MNPPSQPTVLNQAMASTPLQPEPVPHAKLSAELQTRLLYWQAPKQVSALDQLLSQTLHQTPTNTPITRCVCIGVGAFQRGRSWPPPFSRDHPRVIELTINNGLDQTAFLTVLLSLLRKRHPIAEIYLQDPLYNSEEISFLQDHLGYTVLATPHAFDKVTTSTFVFAPRVHSVDVAEALERAHPALFIGNDIDSQMVSIREVGLGVRWGVEAGTVSGISVLETFGKFREGVDARPMPVLRGGEEWCGVVCVYWRRQEEEEEEEEKTGFEVPEDSGMVAE